MIRIHLPLKKMIRIQDTLLWLDNPKNIIRKRQERSYSKTGGTVSAALMLSEDFYGTPPTPTCLKGTP